MISKKRGFTLLEILLVIAAIGILAAIVLIAINPNRQLAQARNTQRRTDINSIYKSLEQYLIDTGSYPIGTINGVSTPIGTTYVDVCSSTNPGTTCLNLNSLLSPQYIAAIPRDAQAAAGISGYQIALNPSNNRISVRASNAEIAQVIVINPFAVSWSPLAASPALWLDANDSATITQSSGNVSQWADKSGNIRNATQGVGGNQPQISANAINGLSALNWGATQGGKSIGYSAAGIVVKEVFIVGDFEGASFNNFPGLFNPFSDSSPFVGVTGFVSNPYFYNYSTNTAYYFTNYYLNASATDSNTNVFPTISSPFILRAEATRTDNNNWAQGYVVGMDRNYNGLNRSWTGLVGEVLVFSSSLSPSDREKVEGYLAHKWGLTSLLPGGHPYKTIAPTQ